MPKLNWDISLYVLILLCLFFDAGFNTFQACFLPLSDASSFVVLYIVTSVYFSGVMVSTK